VALLREARRLGVRLFDTADSYGAGAAEEAVRAALHPYDDLIVTTKGG
jgi:aryl-alcohol dehydrogenase-like predicted oxidoreductase